MSVARDQREDEEDQCHAEHLPEQPHGAEDARRDSVDPRLAGVVSASVVSAKVPDATRAIPTEATIRGSIRSESQPASDEMSDWTAGWTTRIRPAASTARPRNELEIEAEQKRHAERGAVVDERGRFE